jgi:hypothetical protein
MLRNLMPGSTLSATPIEADLSQVTNIDEFILSVHAAGHGAQKVSPVPALHWPPMNCWMSG